jgi:uncharacterized membrane protein YraQ (UPF0718 family)
MVKGFLLNLLSAVTPFLIACWEMLVEMAPYMCLGFLMAGLLHVFVNPRLILRFLGEGRIKSVLYATLLGIPLPLCSCGVLPATAGLKKQGATDGAAMSFMIATPETGVDSMAVTYALLDPIMTVFRPLAAFFTSVAAGLTQNFFGKTYNPSDVQIEPDLSCKIDNCCDGINCPPEVHRHHHTLTEKLNVALKYGFGEILDDISKWLILGIAIAGAISVLVPDSFMRTYLGGGISSMLIMLVVGIPFYTCATSSTPIAAALILKGVSPGAALVFLLAGPATNAATISVVYGLFRKRATVIYLSSIMLSAIIMGLVLDKVYAGFNITASSVAGEAGELIPHWMGHIFALLLAILILNSLLTQWRRKRRGEASCCDHDHGGGISGCGHDQAQTGTTAVSGGCNCQHDGPMGLKSVSKPAEIGPGPNAHTTLFPIDHGNCGHAHAHPHSHIEHAKGHDALASGCCGHDEGRGIDTAARHHQGNCLHDHLREYKEKFKHLPDIVARELAELREENCLLKGILVQRDLEIQAIKNGVPRKS